MKQGTVRSLLIGSFGLLGLTASWCFSQNALAKDPPAPTLSAVSDDLDEFYARVDQVKSSTELAVTILDEWQPMDKVKGARWPGGKGKVQPAQRIIILEETNAAATAEDQKAAVEFLVQALKGSDNEVIVSGSSVMRRKEADTEIVCVTGYVFVKKGGTLNNALVREGLATTTNPIYKSWEEAAKQNKRGMWRDRK